MNQTSNFNIGSAQVGILLVLLSQVHLLKPQHNFTICNSNSFFTSNYNYYPQHQYSYHQGSSVGGTSYVYLYLSLYNTSDELIHRETLTYSYVRGSIIQ